MSSYYYSKYLKYKNKYLKYKTKYLNLFNLLGGGKETARIYFIKNMKDKASIQRDIGFNLLKYCDGFTQEDMVEDTELKKDTLNNIFEQIYVLVNNKDIIDNFCRLYCTGNLGIPNSLENIGRFKYSYETYNELKKIYKKEKKQIPIENIEQFESLTKLEEFISDDTNTKLIADNIKFKAQQERKKLELIQLKAEGEGEKNVRIILDTPNVIIYNPITEAGSKYYGRQTKWCTTSKDNCMFKDYNEKGLLYIIKPKHKRKEEDDDNKYQIHFQEKEIRFSDDTSVHIEEILMKCNYDQEFIDWFKRNTNQEEYIQKIYNIYLESCELIMDNINFMLLESIMKLLLLIDDVPFLKYNISDIKLFKFLLDRFTNLISLTFGDSFNKPLEDSLYRLTNLQSLTFGNNFNTSLGTSLNNLTNLKSLTFGNNFNTSLGTSLNNLTNLKSLTFGNKFNKPLGQVLNRLTNLESLTFGESFNEPLGDSLYRLTNLKSLTFGENFSQFLQNSLYKLVSLESLTFGNNYNIVLGDSLSSLTNLKSLTFGNKFDEPLTPLLVKLSKLEFLTFGKQFNEPLTPLLAKLPNLKRVTLMEHYKFRDYTNPKNVTIIYKPYEIDEFDDYDLDYF
jgi:hypothetical protein